MRSLFLQRRQTLRSAYPLSLNHRTTPPKKSQPGQPPADHNVWPDIIQGTHWQMRSASLRSLVKQARKHNEDINRQTITSQSTTAPLPTARKPPTTKHYSPHSEVSSLSGKKKKPLVVERHCNQPHQTVFDIYFFFNVQTQFNAYLKIQAIKTINEKILSQGLLTSCFNL